MISQVNINHRMVAWSLALNSTESTIRLIFTRLVAKKRLHISRFVGFSLFFLS